MDRHIPNMSQRSSRRSSTTAPHGDTTFSETVSTSTAGNQLASSIRVEVPGLSRPLESGGVKRKHSLTKTSNDPDYHASDYEGNDEDPTHEQEKEPAKKSPQNTSKKTSGASKKMTENRPAKRKRSSTKGSANLNDEEDGSSSDSEDNNDEDPSYEAEQAPGNNSRRNTKKRAVDTTKWKKEADELKKQARVLKSENNGLKKRLKSVTAESIQNARKGSKELWDTTNIVMEFKSLNKDIKKWTKAYAITKTISSLTDDEKENILLDVSLFSNTDILPGNDLSAIEQLPKGATLLLEGFLYAFACGYLICRPFIFTDGALKDHGSKPKRELLDKGRHESQFEKFASQLVNVDEYQSQKWRASMLQSLKQVIIPDFPSDGSKVQRDGEKRSNGLLKKYETEITSLVTEFLKSPAEYLLEYQTEKRQQQREDLKKIFRKFRELAYHMYCQPSTVICQYEHGWSDVMIVFNPDTMGLDATATHGRQDTEAERLAGDEVLISLNPAISGVTIDADNDEHRTVTYLKQRVWTAGCQTFGQWQKALKEQNHDTTTSKSSHAIAPEKTVRTPANDRQDPTATLSHEKNNIADPANVMDKGLYDESTKAISRYGQEPHPDDEPTTHYESMDSKLIDSLQESAREYCQVPGTDTKDEIDDSASDGGY